VSDNISVGLAWPPKMTTICPLGPSAVSPIISISKYFKDEVMAHIHEGRCPLPSSVEVVNGEVGHG
jgi:NADH-quinone oxidoreductase subunit F